MVEAEITAAVDLAPNPAFPKARLVQRTDITEDLMVIRLEPELEGGFSYKPGQYCTLGLGRIERAYSIASAPYEPWLEIFVELVPDGALTPLMWRLQPGDCMSLRPRAKGLFVMNQQVHHHLMLATVTGVAPSVSIIRDYLHRGGSGHKFYVLLGASYYDELTYDAEFHELAAKHPETVEFIPSVSRPDDPRNAGWRGAGGRVNAIVWEHLERLQLPQDDTQIYACGHPGMTEDMKTKLRPLGWKFTEERFWKE